MKCKTKIIMRRSNPPCQDEHLKDCPDRHVGCHSDCEKYIKWKEQQTKEWEAARDHSMQDIIVNDFSVKNAIKMKNKRRAK